MKRSFLFLLILITTIALRCQNSIPPTAGDGSQANPYQIESLENLFWIYCSDEHWDKEFIQTEDIDAGETKNWFVGIGWLAIGVYVGAQSPDNMPFTGSYDGQGYTISNLHLNQPEENYTGLFGYTENAGIRNVVLTGVSVSAYRCVGAIAGILFSGSVMENCRVSGYVSGYDYVGGIIGWAANATITDCSADCEVSANDSVGGLAGFALNSDINGCSTTCTVTGVDNIGGLIGYEIDSVFDKCVTDAQVNGSNRGGGMIGYDDNGLFTDCSSTSTVDCETCSGGLFGDARSSDIINCYCLSQVEGGTSIGGMVGYCSNASVEFCHSDGSVSSSIERAGGMVGYSISSNFTQCYSTPDVSGYNYSGGFIGSASYCDVQDCYSIGNVQGNNSVAGFIGSAYNVRIGNCYSVGSVTGEDNLGGLVGFVELSPVEFSYWDVETSGIATSSAGEGRTTEEMTWPHGDITYLGWDFDSIWCADTGFELNNGYPVLLYTVAADDDQNIAPELAAAQLHQNYPNPFNPSTTIGYSLNQGGAVEITVYNLKGQKVCTLVDAKMPAGFHEAVWDGEDSYGKQSSSGVYFYRMQTSDCQMTRKMLLLK